MMCNIPSADEIFEMACRRAGRIAVKMGKSKRLHGRKLAMSKISVFSNFIHHKLLSIVKEFPDFDRMHPFYREVINLTIKRDELKKSLAAVKWAANTSARIGKIHIRNIRYERGSPRKELSSAYGRVKSVLDRIEPSLEIIGEACRKFRSLPTIDFSKPVVVVAGYPNVGKSMLVSRLSTATPEVAHYPFTTKGIVIGHVNVDDRVLQIVDTPGLLDRPPEKQNPLEKQAMSALRHLANLILFVFDPSETCGISMKEQKMLLRHISDTFKGTSILAIENKCDIADSKSYSGRLRVSAKTGEGIDALLKELKNAISSIHFEYLGGVKFLVE